MWVKKSHHSHVEDLEVSLFIQAVHRISHTHRVVREDFPKHNNPSLFKHDVIMLCCTATGLLSLM